MFKKILVPLDGSRLAEKALPYAGALAQQFGAELILVMVLHRPLVMPLDYGVTLPPVEEITAHEQQTARDYLGRLQAELGQRHIPTRIIVLENLSTAEAIIDLASQEEVDLIVKTTHGRSGPSRWIFGNVALKVLQQAPCPVFLVRIKAGEPTE
jgi:nucleotide-binding universal stress UspA family protein